MCTFSWCGFNLNETLLSCHCMSWWCKKSFRYSCHNFLCDDRSHLVLDWLSSHTTSQHGCDVVWSKPIHLNGLSSSLTSFKRTLSLRTRGIMSLSCICQLHSWQVYLTRTIRQQPCLPDWPSCWWVARTSCSKLFKLTTLYRPKRSAFHSRNCRLHSRLVLRFSAKSHTRPRLDKISSTASTSTSTASQCCHLAYGTRLHVLNRRNAQYQRYLQ